MFKHLFQSEAVKQLLGSYNKPMRKSKSLDIKDLQTGVTSKKGKKGKNSIKVSKGTKIRNRYNQVPHLIR